MMKTVDVSARKICVNGKFLMNITEKLHKQIIELVETSIPYLQNAVPGQFDKDQFIDVQYTSTLGQILTGVAFSVDSAIQVHGISGSVVMKETEDLGFVQKVDLHLEAAPLITVATSIPKVEGQVC